MLKLESKTAIANGSQEKVFNFLSDFRNMENMLPKDVMKNIEVLEQQCNFEINGIGTVGLVITEKVPYSQVKINGTESGPADFTLMIYLSPYQQSIDQSDIKFTLDASLNMYMEMLAKKPLQQFIDMLADKVEQKDFTSF